MQHNHCGDNLIADGHHRFNRNTIFNEWYLSTHGDPRSGRWAHVPNQAMGPQSLKVAVCRWSIGTWCEHKLCEQFSTLYSSKMEIFKNFF